MKSKIAALSFLLFILLIIVAADAGRLPVFIQMIYAFPNGDRIGHVGLYGVLAFLCARAFPRPLQIGSRFIPLACVILLAFSAAEEASQAWFATRTPDFVDFACSWTGVLLGSLAARSRKRAGTPALQPPSLEPR